MAGEKKKINTANPRDEYSVEDTRHEERFIKIESYRRKK